MAQEIRTLQAPSRWATYLPWNNAVADVIFSKEAAGAPAYLDLEEDVLRRVAEAAGYQDGDPREALAAAVRGTLNPVGFPSGVFGTQLFRLHLWKPGSTVPPPCVGLLAVLSLAAEDMGNEDGLAPHNYYKRLMALLGFRAPREQTRVEEEYRQCSDLLWESLNRWLEDLQGERGLPTAYAYSTSLPYVGRPLSQALLRATDRGKLEHLFAHFGLAPRARMSPQDMQALLERWVASEASSASHSLRAMWRRSAARSHIAEAACHILETWDGPREPESGDHKGVTRPRVVSLHVLLRTFPAPTVEFNLIGGEVIPAHVEATVEFLDAESGHSPAVEMAVEPLPVGGWRLADPGQLDAASLLERRIRLRSSLGAAFERRPRRVIPLRRDPLLQGFIEVERLPLGEEALLLARAELTEEIIPALAGVARPGFKTWDSGVSGCPAGWVLFSNVQVLKGLGAVNPTTGRAWIDDLNVLQPLATAELVLQGGLQLPGRVRGWSSLAPPEVRATTGEETGGLIVRIDALTAGGPKPVSERSFSSPIAIIPLESLGLADGDYDVRAFETQAGRERRVDAVKLRLRSGNDPVPLMAASAALLRDLSDPAIAAVRAVRSVPGGPFIRGPVIDGLDGRGPSLIAGRIPSPAWWLRRQANPAPALQQGAPALVVAPGEKVDCMVTGAHHMVLPTFYGKTSKWFVEGTCRNCGLVKRYPARPNMLMSMVGPPQSPAPGRNAPPRQPTFDVAAVEPICSDRPATPNVALDALTHLRRGSAAAFEQLALQVEPSRLFVDVFVRNLEALGHIEAGRDPRTLALTEWEVAPPALVELEAGGVCLVGARSEWLCQAVERTAHKLRTTLHRQAQLAAPDRLLVSGLDSSVLQEFASLVSMEASIEVEIVRNASRRLASRLPTLGAVLRALPRQPMPGFRSVSCWDANLTKWRPAPDAGLPGAYLLVGATRTYCLRDADDIAAGTMRRADARLVKHAMALERGETLLAYHSESRTLLMPLGADLPGLYARAAVIASGLRPTESKTERVVGYRDIPADLAEHLVALLSG